MKKSIRGSFEKLADAESKFIGSEFLAPVGRGHGVTVKIAAIRCTLSVDPADFSGWGVFTAVSHSQARLLREASAVERRRYLQLLPSVQLVVCSIERSQIGASPANLADDRFRFTTPVPLQLAPRVELFETVVSRFDGARFWFDQIDPRADAATATHLRRELARMADPKDLDRAGLTSGQRIAYALEYVRRATAILADQRSRADARLALALAHAGAELRDFADGIDTYRVTFMVDGQRHTSVVRKDDLTIRSAGICLSGRDEDFDLTSLIGVLREATS
jgi:hypothetical protein